MTSSCLAISGDMDTTMGSLGCKNLPVSGSVQVSGKWTVKADGSYKDDTTTKGSMTFTLEPSCLSVSSVPVPCEDMGIAFKTLGWSDTTCSEVGGKCACKAETNLAGGLGVPSIYASDSGNYVASDGNLTLDEQVDYSYCVEGSKLTASPKPTFFPMKGTIVLQKSETPTGGTGGGGASGSSLSGGKGGSAGAGGSSVTGGRGGSAGASSVPGGTTGSAGKGGTGGTSAVTGGTTRTGGTSTAAGGTTSTGGTSTGGTSAVGGGSGSRPCDIYEAANFPCAAAHSTIRALFASYSGKLYQVRRASDRTFLDIGTLSAGGMADAAAQDAFCKGTTCLITRIYDQTKNGNFLGCQSKDQVLCPDVGSPNTGDSPASATNESLKVGGANVYALRMNVGNAYWRDVSKSGMRPYATMNKQGSIILGSGGDCCYSNTNGSKGVFYEGAIVAGYPDDATEDKVQENIVNAGCGK